MIIPQYIKGFAVKHIIRCAFKYDYFQGSKITTLKLPDSLLSIGFNAFFDHHIRDLEIPDSVTSIENNAFNHICYDLFHTIKIPANVELDRNIIGEGFTEYYSMCDKQGGTYIREDCWYKKGDNDTWDYYIENGCAVITGYHGNETEVTIPSEINKIPVSAVSGHYSGFGIFDYVKHEINTVIISEGITKINKNTFIGDIFLHKKKISKVIFPKSLTWIGGDAFIDNNLENIIIPSNVTWIGENAIKNNKINTITLPDSNIHISKYAFSYNQITSIIISDNAVIDDCSFFYNPITDITIGSDVKMGSEVINADKGIKE